MRFMLLMIPRVYQPGAELTPDELAGIPTAEQVAAMMKFNEDLQKGGHLVALDGLHPLSKGARIAFNGGKPIVTDGPFAETKEASAQAARLLGPEHDRLDPAPARLRDDRLPAPSARAPWRSPPRPPRTPRPPPWRARAPASPPSRAPRARARRSAATSGSRTRTAPPAPRRPRPPRPPRPRAARRCRRCRRRSPRRTPARGCSRTRPAVPSWSASAGIVKRCVSDLPWPRR